MNLTVFDLFSDTHSPILGLSVELAFPKKFSFEVNALHRTLNLENRLLFPDGTRSNSGGKSIATWEFPVLLKYRLPGIRGLRPFLEGGPSFRTRDNPAPTEPSQFGATAGAGVEFHLGRFRLSPAVQYTRWQFDGNYPRIATKRDQLEFLTGISYPSSPAAWKVRGRKIGFGLIAGTPITGGIENSPSERRFVSTSESQGYIAGLAAELEITSRFTIEVDGLYRPFRAHNISVSSIPSPLGGLVPNTVQQEFTVLTWQLPALVKYRIDPRWGLRPFFETGPSFRVSGNLNGYDPSYWGFTAGGGAERQVRSMRIAPVLRLYAMGSGCKPGSTN